MAFKNQEDKRAYDRQWRASQRSNAKQQKSFIENTGAPQLADPTLDLAPKAAPKPRVAAPTSAPLDYSQSRPPEPSEAKGAIPSDLLDTIRPMLTKPAADGDSFAKTFDKIIEHAPKVIGLIQQLIEGYQSGMQAHAQAAGTTGNGGARTEYVVPQPPQGYGTIDALRFENNPQWRKARDAYVAYKNNGTLQAVTILPNGARSLQAPTPRDAAVAQYEQRQTEMRGLPQASPADFEAMSRATNQQFPIDNSDTPKVGVPVATVEQETTTTAPTDTEAKPDDVIQVLRNDNIVLVNSLVDKINALSIEELEAYVTDREQLVAKLKLAHAFGMIGAQYRELITVTTEDAIVDMLANRCAERWDAIAVKGKHEDELRLLWREIQAIIVPPKT